MQILAESIGPVVLILFLAPIILAVLSRVAMIVLKSKRGERPWWGLVIGLLSIISGAAMLIMLATTRGGAQSFFYLIAILPILSGMGCLIVWNRKPKS
jgi:uncharacterized membrane protein HdeD (DUF308 family)